MEHLLQLYNTLDREKQNFVPSNSPYVGMYVCGPTVYGDAHLGHSRAAITFDILFRYLLHLGYKVRYVRNITDVGHLVNDADEGEDKIQKKARLEQIEPMEVVQHFSDRYHRNMDQLNVLKPSIEPRASGHIIEQLQMIDRIYETGLAYEVNGSVYFDVGKYHKKHHYGKLSGRVIEDLMNNTRDLEAQSEKRSPLDFALWKKADQTHLMHWPSRWSEGFPGWHLECSAMSTKYLGETFDIHGGGMDLLFPHHECEIAQSVAANGKESVRFWVHNNMITINGQKMGKSLGNFITLDEFFTGSHAMLEKAYSPMSIRFFILQAHYRSTLDFSNEAVQSAEKGLHRLMGAWKNISKIKPSEKSSWDVTALIAKCYQAMNDDLNTPIAIANLFDGARLINSTAEGSETLCAKDLDSIKNFYSYFITEILGISALEQADQKAENTAGIIEILLNLRLDAKRSKDFATSDKIRDELAKAGVLVKDRKDGSDWEWKI